MKRLSKDSRKSNVMDGLYIQNGREINDRQDSQTGIAQASMYRKQMKKQYKIDCIADGIEKAKMRMDGRNVFGM